MKRNNALSVRTFGIIAIVAIIGFTFAACDNAGDDDGGGLGSNGEVPGKTLAEKLAWVKENAQSNTNYLLTVNTDEQLYFAYGNYTILSCEGKSNITITLKGSGGEKVLSSSAAVCFIVKNGVTLVLDNNITLQGTGMLVLVEEGGALIMNAGAKITGNGDYDDNSSKVVLNGGTFTMNGGEISGNATGVGVATNSTFIMNGGKISGNTARLSGGVHLGGTFIMNNGEISGNTSTGSSITAGGVCVLSSNSTFTMNGGKISGNSKRYGDGGGVHVNQGIFTMNGGEISNNTCTTISSSSYGGGVYLRGTFTMNGGEISGNTAYYGGGVYAGGGTFRIITGTIYGAGAGTNSNTASRETAALALNNDYTTAQRGTFSGSTWNSSGNLTTTDSTIRVVNGVLQ